MKIIGRVISFVCLTLLLFAFGFGWRDIRQGRVPSGTVIANALSFAVTGNDNVSPTQEFTQAYERIRADYYKPVPADKLTYAGMEGLMASLGDPHTMFLPPTEAQEFNLETQAHFVGVGARLAPDALGAKVAVVFDDGPAFHAGLKVGDIITGVDGNSMVGVEIDKIVSKIRGEEGTMVSLRVIRIGSVKPITLVAKRATVITPTVTGESIIPGTHIGYLSVSSFSQPTADQFDAALDKIDKQHPNGLVIDLRENPGGLLETAVTMLSRFVEGKTIVTMKMKDGQVDTATAHVGEKRNFTYPVAVLINEDSASAAEIFSGVLQDYRLATLVGTHSYGKASVQNVTQLVGGSSAKITIARYYLPSARDIGRKVDEEGQFISGGLTPDVKAELDADKQVIIGDLKTDTQLQKAVQVLQAKQ